MKRRNPRYYHRDINNLPEPLTSEQINLMTDFIESEGYQSCLHSMTCNLFLYVEENIPVDSPAARAFLNENVLRASAISGISESINDLIEEMRGDLIPEEIVPETTEEETLEGVNSLPEVQEPVQANATPPIPPIRVLDSADQAYPFIRMIDTVVVEGNEPISPTYRSEENLYDTGLLNTNGVIYLKQYTIDTNETGIVFKFQYAPQDISWQRNATLETDPAWGTNVQPKHFTATTGKKLNLSNIIIEGMTLNNIVTNSIKALEMLISINENSPAARVTPYCYKLIIGDRVFSDPMTGRHIPFVITSLQVKEEEFTKSGEILSATVNLGLEEVPWYQVNDGRKLMLLFEDSTTEEEDNCEQLAAQVVISAKTIEELAAKWDSKPRVGDLSGYANSTEQAEALTDCATLNQEFINLLKGVEAQRNQSCENIESGASGANAYNQIWSEDGYFGHIYNEANPDNVVSQISPLDFLSLGGIPSALFSGFSLAQKIIRRRRANNRLNSVLGPASGCRPVNESPSENLELMRASMQDVVDSLKAGNACERGETASNIGILFTYDPDDFPTQEAYCLATYQQYLNRAGTALNNIQNPEIREFQELQLRYQAKYAMDYFAQEYNRLLEESNGAFLQLDEKACNNNANCALWRDYDEALTNTAATFGLDDYLSELFNLDEEEPTS